VVFVRVAGEMGVVQSGIKEERDYKEGEVFFKSGVGATKGREKVGRLFCAKQWNAALGPSIQESSSTEGCN
jgi:hypothetical protein